VGADELTQPDAQKGQLGQYGRRGASTGQSGVDARRESFAFNDVALRRAHQRGNR
jgi:hypothetical protein